MQAQYVVLAMAENYNWTKLCTFVVSLRKTGYDGDIVMFVSENLDSFTKLKMAEYSVSWIPVVG